MAIGQTRARGEDPQGWLDRVYDREAVVIQVDDGSPDGDRGRHITSSASHPGVVAVMLAALDGQTVPQRPEQADLVDGAHHTVSRRLAPVGQLQLWTSARRGGQITLSPLEWRLVSEGCGDGGGEVGEAVVRGEAGVHVVHDVADGGAGGRVGGAE